MVKNVAYLRISLERENLENQKSKIRLNHPGEDIVFFEEIEHGDIEVGKRKVYQEMLKFISINRPEKLYVAAYSRLGRDVRDTFLALKDLTENYNIIVESESEMERFLNDLSVFKSFPAMRDFLLSMFNMIAAMELEQIRERTRTSLTRIKEEINRTGRHTVIKNGEITNVITHLGRPDKKFDDKTIKKILEMRHKKYSWALIGRELGISYSTVNKYKKMVEPS